MQQEFIIKQNRSSLLLFFAGWGMDKHPFVDYKPAHHDFMICYNYNTLEFDYNLISGYKQVEVVAWSMGVWVASQIMSSAIVPLGLKIAINGTMYPIDEQWGIPPAIFNGTLEGLTETTLSKFQRRMCGNTVNFKYFQSVIPQRTIDSLKSELSAIGKMYKELPPKGFDWDETYIGLNDRIFPANNQQQAWQSSKTTVTLEEESHYSQRLFTNYLEKVWIKN